MGNRFHVYLVTYDDRDPDWKVDVEEFPTVAITPTEDAVMTVVSETVPGGEVDESGCQLVEQIATLPDDFIVQLREQLADPHHICHIRFVAETESNPKGEW